MIVAVRVGKIREGRERLIAEGGAQMTMWP